MGTEQRNPKTNKNIQKRMVKKKKEMLVALEESMGIVTIACKKVGMSRKQFYEWKQLDTEFNLAVTELQDMTGDMVESQLLRNIMGGDIASTIFYAKTKLRNRGYSEQIDVKYDGDIIINFKKKSELSIDEPTDSDTKEIE